jgi:hypothetical protein
MERNMLVQEAQVDPNYEETGRTLRVTQSTIVIIIVGYMVLTSAFNMDIKALVWGAQICLWFVLIRMVVPDLKCKTDHWVTPIMSSFCISYTMGYLAAPMAVNNDWNPVVLVVFAILYGLDFSVSLTNCNPALKKTHLAIAGVGGLILGMLFYLLLKTAGLGKFLYYTTGTGNVYCSKPKEQDFKCYVYKNGQIISSL